MLAARDKTYADHWLLLANIIAMLSQAHRAIRSAFQMRVRYEIASLRSRGDSDDTTKNQQQ
jgi:hypothetical protein